MDDMFYSLPLQETNTKRRRGRNMQKQQAALANAVSGVKGLMSGKGTGLVVYICPPRASSAIVFEMDRLFPVQSAPFILWSPAFKTTCAHYFTVVNPIRF